MSATVHAQPSPGRPRPAPGGFTLVEILVAVTILGIVSTIVALVMGVGIEAWRATTEMAEETHDGDAIMEQVVMALRSAYYPSTGEATYDYGFQHEDGGEDENASDSVSWTKIGSTLVGEDVPWAGSAHRVRLFLSKDEGGQGEGLYVQAWQMVGEPEDFDPDEEAVPVLLSDRVVGFDCRMRDPEKEAEPGEPFEWIDEWTESNRIPACVRLTLALSPRTKKAKPDVVVRLVEIPMSALSWNVGAAGAAGDGATTGRVRQGDVRQGGADGADGGVRPGGVRPGGTIPTGRRTDAAFGGRLSPIQTRTSSRNTSPPPSP